MDEQLKTIKLALLKILSEGTLMETDITKIKGKEPEDEFHLEDLTCDDILLFSIPLIEGMLNNNINKLEAFINTTREIFESKKDLDYSYNETINTENITFESIQKAGNKIVQETNQAYYLDVFKVTNNIKNGILNRMDRIYINTKIKDLNYNYIDWDDKSVLKQLLEVCYYKALLYYRFTKSEENIKNNIEANNKEKKTQVLEMFDCGHLNPIKDNRKTLLSRRIKPNMSMDEYVVSIMDDVRERESIKPEIRVKDLDYYRKSDKEKDKRENFKGNTRNVS